VTDIAVSLEHVGKRFIRHVDRRNSLKERIIRGRSRTSEDFWAVKDVNIEIPKGSVFGLIGHNGSGKSTLLKLMSGIYRPTEGKIHTDGRLAALIELGAGFHPDMTGLENIKLNGSILGLSRKEINDSTQAIIDFSGLREFINDPVKHYSSGMYVRLGFSVAVHMKPDILIVDEVLAVGDEEFQRRCEDHLYSLRRAGKTIIVVSHGMGQLESLCDEISWLEHGQVQETGPATKVIRSYLERVNNQESVRNAEISADRSEDEGSMRAGSGQIRTRSIALRNVENKPLDHAETGSTTRFAVTLNAKESILGPNVRLAIQHEGGALVTMLNNHRLGTDLGVVDGDFTVFVDLLNTPLLPGRYRIHIDVFDHTGAKLLDNWSDALEFPARSQRGEIGQGFVELPAQFTLSTPSTPPTQQE
jgi:ABC-2 type transport system ATP-binding protein/lipopolysaccharide transport system ATP-binding protein